MVRRFVTYGICALLGIALGLASALWMAGLWPGAKPLDFGDVEVNGWRSDFAIGSEAADPYTRARVARHGLLALAKTEAVYFTRTTDGQGEPLRAECDYRVSGGTMPAQWWSLTLYTSNSMLPMNEDAALSVDATSVSGSSGDWSAFVSATRPEAGIDWISSKNAGRFDLMLRLYVPTEELLTNPDTTLSPPIIERLGCRS